MNSKLLFSVFGIFVLAILMSVVASAQGSGLGGREWKLVQMNGKAVSGDTRARIEFDTSKKRFTGNAGCNRMFGRYASEKGSLKFSAVGATRMACPGKIAKQEAEFVKALDNATHYRVSGNTLRIYSGRKPALKFIAVYKQNGETPSSGQPRLEDKKWVLEATEGKPAIGLKTAAFVVFDAAKQSAGGNTSCNAFGGSYEANGNRLKISQIISTMRACIEDNRMAIERSFLDGLENADRYEIKDGKLEIYKGEKLLLTFVGKSKD